MSSPEKIGQKVDATLASLQNIQRARANPFLYTRIRAAMEHKPERLRGVDFLLKPSVAMIGALLIILLNTLVFLPEWKQESTAINDEEELSYTAAYHFNKPGDDNIYSLLEEEQP